MTTRKKAEAWDAHTEHLYRAVLKLESCLGQVLSEGAEAAKWKPTSQEAEALNEAKIALALAEDKRPQDYPEEVPFDCDQDQGPEAVTVEADPLHTVPPAVGFPTGSSGVSRQQGGRL